jgi:protein involved in polysaccharide export with SLBB domain
MSLPLLGEFQVPGQPSLQLEQGIASKLRHSITKPEVTMMAEQTNAKKFNILGQVIKPGSHSLALAPTIVDESAIAGAPRDFAKQKTIYILQQNPGGGQTRILFNYKKLLKGYVLVWLNADASITSAGSLAKPPPRRGFGEVESKLRIPLPHTLDSGEIFTTLVAPH